jgi:ABC-type transport system involved in multi-copper enzyme maturation permease subunit
MRTVSDIGAASISLYAVVVAVVIGATSLYREVELKTIFPILARPIRRGEYLVGKYLGVVFTLVVFVIANAAVLFLALAFMAEVPLAQVLGTALGSVVVASFIAFRYPRSRTIMPFLWAVVVFVIAYFMAEDSLVHRRVVVHSALLSVLEVAILAAITTLFASFSSPFLSAVLTFAVFLVGRSADTLARLPEAVFGSLIKSLGTLAAHVVPNLMLYVPPRPLLAGELPDVAFEPYLGQAALFAAAWSVGLLTLASLIFRRRDFL